jgi:cytochrome c peroxidase
MHQGQFADLARVVEYYSTLEGMVEPRGHRERILVPRKFSDDEKRDLVAFLESLTDDSVDSTLLVRPASPLLP